jgi:hypothetical protein
MWLNPGSLNWSGVQVKRQDRLVWLEMKDPCGDALAVSDRC